MFRPFLAVCAVALFGSTSFAAIIYEPVQYQYRDPRYGTPTFYYGGSNPRVFAIGANLQARYNAAPDTNRERRITVSTASETRHGFNLLNPGLVHTPPIVYTDYLPAGINGYPYGFNVEAARNEAYANVPLYFRKADLLASAEPTPDGHLVVSPQAPYPGTIEITPSRHHGPATQPASQPSAQPVLIIPKGLLNKPLNPPTPPASVARAN